MMDQNNNNKRFLKCFLAGMVIIIFICLIHVSGTLAQWSPYSNVGWASQPFFGSSFFSFKLISVYTGAYDNGFSTPYGNYPSSASYLSPGLWSSRLERFGNFSYNDIFSPYSSILSSGSFFSPAFSSFNSSGATSPLYPKAVYVGQYDGVLYTGSTGYNPFYPGISSSAFIPNTPSPYTMNLAWYSPWISPPSFLPSSIIQVPWGGSHESKPAYAPEKMTGEWQSQQLTDEDGNKIKGKLEYDRKNGLLKMSDSSLPLGEGELKKFEYTPTSGKVPISFEGLFNSGYTAYFSGTADNHLCPRDAYCFYAGYFDVEGTYQIKDNEGQVVDKGTFKL